MAFRPGFKVRRARNPERLLGENLLSPSKISDSQTHAAGPTKQTRSLSEDGGSQGQLWMQLDALQKENVRLAEANHVLNTQLASSSAQREKLQSRWAEQASRLEKELRAAEKKAKADEARQTVEMVSAENAQLGAHVQLLESELEAVQAGALGHQPGSSENSPRGTAEHPLGFGLTHGVTPQTAVADSRDELAEEGASPAFSLIENTAFHQDGSGASRPSTAGSREDAGPVAAKEGMTTSEKAEADFHFSSLKRKWHAEEGKYLAHELRRAQDLNVQQEMELESLRQQEHIQGLHSQGSCVAELEQEVQLKAQGTTELESALAEAKARAAELLPLEEALRVKEEDAQAMSDRIAQQQAELLHIKQEKSDDDMEKQKRLQELEASLQAAQKQMEDLHSMVEAERAKSASTDIILAETVLTLDQAKTDADAKKNELLRLKAHMEATEQSSLLASSELETRLAAVTSELNQAQAAMADKDRHSAEMEAEQDVTELQRSVSSKDAEIASLKKQLDSAAARADGHYAALQEINQQLQDIQRSHKEALQKSTAAAQEKEQMLAEMEKLGKAHAAERHGLKEKLERLQRANKQRRSEIEEMQTKLSSMHQRASAYDQTSQELQQLRKEHSEIKPLAAAHPQLVEEVSACRAEVKAAEKRIASFDALAKKAATVFETRLTSIERERDQLLEQVAVLKSATVANEALQLQAAAAQRDLAAAQEAAATAASHQHRAAAAEKAAAEARKEAQSARAAAAAMEERLQAAEEEMDRITGAVEEERAWRAAAARAYAEELEGLPLKPVSAWPAPVRALVRQREAAAAEAGAAAVRQEASVAEAALEAELEEARTARGTAEAEKREAIAARDKAEAHTAGVSKELAEREECLGNLLEAARAEAAAATAAHETDLAELRQSLELRVATVRADVADWQARAEAAEKDLAAVKERAWALMEEKDAQLQAAKALKNHVTEGPADETGSSAAVVDEVSVLKQRISLLEKELVESENTHRLRDQAQAVAKQEIAELQRKGKREGLDLTYLKNVILGGFESGELPAKSSMLPVLGRLLEFSPKELDRVRNPKRKA
ncbi:hypothetical protein WJX75_007487 [Coccomyxa subellipsoidea]|uniref:GRIP domain-containing protein n=1 Tax=Coccomyxa subellipsoidea TaxID=248742 RepID=A0ABR2YIM8_9CHLO